MRTPRFTIAKLMGIVASSAILLAVFRLGSFAGLVALLPLAITAIVARLGGGPSGYRQALWVGAAGTLLLPFLAAIWLNYLMWGYFVTRPPVDRRIVNSRQIETIGRVEAGSDSRWPYVYERARWGDGLHSVAPPRGRLLPFGSANPACLERSPGPAGGARRDASRTT